MAKKKSTKKQINKSAEIRNYLERHPGAGAKQIISALAAKGIEVAEGLVANVKSRTSKTATASTKRPKKKTAKRSQATKKSARKKKGTSRKTSASRPSDDLKQAGDLMRHAVDLVIKAGAKEAKQLVGMAEELIRSIRER